MFFDNVRLTKDDLLGELNHGFYYLMQELPQERLLIADMGIASAEAVFELTRDYMKERKAFGTYIHTYIYIHACIHTYIHTYIHTHIYIYI